VTERQLDFDATSHDHGHALTGGGHLHGHQAAGPSSPWARRFAIAVLVCAAVVTLVSMVLLWPDGSSNGSQGPGEPPARLSGEIVSVKKVECPAPPPGLEEPAGPFIEVCGSVTVRLTGGSEAGQLVSTDIPTGPGAPDVEPGDRVVVIPTPDAFTENKYQVIDHQRGQQMWLLILAGALAIVAFGRWRGLAALAGLAVTFAILLVFVVPAILDGRPALLVAIVGAAAIMLLVLYLTHGLNARTSVAVLGTLASLVLTGVLAAVTTAALNLTGVASEEASFLTVTYSDVNMHGLLLAGILIGSLGVLDDVAVTQAATVSELAAANHTLTAVQLYRAAARVGRSHIASVVNTIVLAYAGASLPLLLLLAGARVPAGEVLTSQLLAEEIVRSVVGTIGLVAAVPITTALAAAAARRSAPRPARQGTVSPRYAGTVQRHRSWLDPWDETDETHETDETDETSLPARRLSPPLHAHRDHDDAR
jgi:uncharacterized membrane protein